jgi:hypothetical protein
MSTESDVGADLDSGGGCNVFGMKIIFRRCKKNALAYYDAGVVAVN